MSQVEYRNTYSWQGAIALGPRLVSLSEDLPLHEQTGLVMQLHEFMVELPAMVAADLVDDTKLRFAPLYRLTAALELIERVYPALDGTQARQDLDTLGHRLSGASFADLVPSATPIPEYAESHDHTEADASEHVAEPITVHAQAPADEPTPREHVPAEPAPAQSEYAPAPHDPAATPLVPATASAVPQAPQVTSIHVQPDIS